MEIAVNDVSICAVCSSPISTEKENTAAPAVIPEDMDEQSRATAIAIEIRNAICDSAPRVCASCENEVMAIAFASVKKGPSPMTRRQFERHMTAVAQAYLDELNVRSGRYTRAQITAARLLTPVSRLVGSIQQFSSALSARHKIRPWDMRGEQRNRHCRSKECSKPANGCLCLCTNCRGEWQKEMSAFQKTFEENWAEFKLARDVHNDPRGPNEALRARRAPGSPEPGSMEWVKVVGSLAGMNDSYNAHCRVMAERMHAMARGVASAEDAIQCRKEAERWERGGPLADEAEAVKTDTIKSSLRDAGNPNDDEELVKEVEEVLLKAGYPDDLNRYFEVLRRNGLSLKLAATQVHDSRGKFESWEFSSSAGHSSSVIVRFWHDNHTVDWDGILYDEKEPKEKAVDHSLNQLVNVLERWAAMVDASADG